MPCRADALDKVSVTAQVHAGTKAGSGGGAAADTQSRKLEVNLTNRTKENLTGLKVKWTLFGSDLKDDDTVAAESGEEKTDLAPGRATKFETKDVEFHFSRATVQRTRSGNRGGARARRVPASGTRYAGWGVRVYQGETLIGEAYSLPEFKGSM
jgi:hypothetical protein